MSAVRRFFSGLCGGLALFGSVAVLAQQTTDQVKADAKAFARTLIPGVKAAATTGPTSNNLPNYQNGAPAETSLYNDPSSLHAQGESAAASSASYQQMQTSMNTRAKFQKSDLDAVVARSLAIQDNPNALVGSYTGGGSTGTCRPIPPGTGSPGWSEETCNTGYKVVDRTDSCTPVLRPVVTKTTVTTSRYECSEFDAGFNRTDDCSLYESAMASGQCKGTGWRAGRCLQGPPNKCTEPGEPIRSMSCTDIVPGGRLLGQSTSTQVDVQQVVDDSSCAGKGVSNCQAPVDVCTDATPETREIDGVPVTASCWAWNRTWQCKALDPAQDCSALEARGCSFERQTCIGDDNPCLTWDKTYKCPIPATATDDKQFICDGDVYCINGDCETIDRTPNTEFGQAVMALNSVADASHQLDPNNLTIFKGTRNTCSKVIFGLTNCCAPRGLPIVGGGCDNDDKVLKDKRDKGLCHYVGSYCSSKFLGVCLKKKEAHCCYGSKLARIIQEQGRPQLGLGWGDPKTAQCEGFTVDQFARLDLSRMDFSEVMAEFVEAAKLPDELQTATTVQHRITDYYSSHR